MSVLLDYKSTTDPSGTVFGVRNGTVQLQQPIYFDPNKKMAFRVIRAIMSPEIPNIFSYGGINNTQINLSNDGGATWVTCQLKTGVYTIAMLNDSINNVASQLGWWTNNADPGYDLNYNPATQMVYVGLDSTKLALGVKLGIDFGVSQIYKTLGYTLANSQIIVDGITTATLAPQLDFQGTYVEVFMSCIQGTRWINGQVSNCLCRIPITATTTEIVWPSGTTGMITPLVQASIPSVIQGYDVTIRNGVGNDCVFMYGGFLLEVEIVTL